jgi:hypothetical protein
MNNLTRFVETLPINGTVGQGFAGGNTVTIDGTRARITLSASSVIAFAGAGNPALLKTNANLVKPEELRLLNWDTDHLLIEHLSILTDITICILILLVT